MGTAPGSSKADDSPRGGPMESAAAFEIECGASDTERLLEDTLQKRSAGLAMALVMAAAVGWTAEIQVKTTAGLVKGTTTEDGRIRVYKGIPFGAPPVGELRWQAPRPAAAWPGVREATEFGSRCMQGPIFSDIAYTNKSEDCLNLNLWTPAQKADEGLPVMVWIHGGGF